MKQRKKRGSVGQRRARRAGEPRPLSVLTLDVETDRADEIVRGLSSSGRYQPVQLERPGCPHAWIDVYLASDVECLLLRESLRGRRGVIAAQTRLCRQRDWGDFWRTHFRTLDLGRRLRIKPAWLKGEGSERGRTIIVIDPGLSFGTGDHFTTQFCLETIERLCDRHSPASLLDAGTGSGILAIAAARLGCRRVIAIDDDPQAIRQARRNARLNGVGRRIAFRIADARKLSAKEKVDIVCANLYSGLLSELAPLFRSKAGAFVVLSGIRETDMDSVSAAYQTAGAEEVVRDGNGEWGGLVFRVGPAGTA